MRDLLRVWRRVEALPVPAGVLAEWRAWLGDDLAVVQPCLRPEQPLATAYPCPHPVHDGCPRRVVHDSAERIVAVCGNTPAQCEPLELERRDLVIHTLDPARWLAEVTAALRAANGLTEVALTAPAGVVPVGTLARRSQRLAVVWIRDPDRDVETITVALRSRLDGDGLVVLRPPGSDVTDQLLPGGIVLLAPPDREDGDLELFRALDLIDPGYRTRRVDDPSAIFDEVTLELATVPGKRHVVRVDGHELGGFQRSDVKFLRLLLLAAARLADPGPEGGWVRKTKLQDDDKNHETEAVRFELEKGHHPRLTPAELKALVKTSPRRDGTVRLAVRPERIRLDASLARLEFVGEQQTQPASGKRRQTAGSRQLAQNQAQGRAVSEALLAAARKLGAPSPAADRG